MKNFDEIGKTLPYRQTDEQVDALLEQITANTISIAGQRRQRTRVRRIAFISSAAAAVAVFASIALRSFIAEPSAYDAVMQSSSVSEVLNQMDDSQAASEIYYTQNAMPEYYY